jgi:hypothetical protein
MQGLILLLGKYGDGAPGILGLAPGAQLSAWTRTTVLAGKVDLDDLAAAINHLAYRNPD